MGGLRNEPARKGREKRQWMWLLSAEMRNRLERLTEMVKMYGILLWGTIACGCLAVGTLFTLRKSSPRQRARQVLQPRTSPSRSQATAQRRCVSCGEHAADAGARWCGSCGRRLGTYPSRRETDGTETRLVDLNVIEAEIHSQQRARERLPFGQTQEMRNSHPHYRAERARSPQGRAPPGMALAVRRGNGGAGWGTAVVEEGVAWWTRHRRLFVDVAGRVCA